MIDLKPGEVVCPECNGSGESITYLMCYKCYGAGKLDWIEAITGKDMNEWYQTEVLRTPLSGKDRKIKEEWSISFEEINLFNEDLFDETESR